MDCRNHPDVRAVDRCVGCAESFCDDCLVAIHGQRYCGSCKIMTLPGQEVVLNEGIVLCKEAKDALVTAVISLFCFGFILAPVALVKANQALKELNADPTLRGRGRAWSAIALAVPAAIFSILNLLLRFTTKG